MRATPFVMAWMVSASLAGGVAARPVEDASALASAGAETLVIADVRFELRRVTKGTFRMGSPADSRWHAKDEVERDVTLTKDFAMLDAPVTRGQYAAFVADTGYLTETERATPTSGLTWRNPGFPQTDEHPVVAVTYTDAVAFVSWLSAKTGRAARLPTEAEYEYAARAGTTTAWYVGDDETAARTIGVFEAHGTAPVKQRVPNAWGFFDLSGNVDEWCSAHESDAGDRRVLRGGSWRSAARDTRSASRRAVAPSTVSAENGFRFLLTAEAPVAPLASLDVPPLGSVRNKLPREPEPAAPRADESSWGPNLAILAAVASIPVLFLLLRPKKGP